MTPNHTLEAAHQLLAALDNATPNEIQAATAQLAAMRHNYSTAAGIRANAKRLAPLLRAAAK